MTENWQINKTGKCRCDVGEKASLMLNREIIHDVGSEGGYDAEVSAVSLLIAITQGHEALKQ